MSSPTILICETEAIVALDLQQTLHGMGYDAPIIVSSGEEAVRVACSMNPSLVLTEVRLSGKLDGIAAASLVRSFLDVPVVYLAGDADDAALERARATRPYGFLLKPFSSRQLQVTIGLAFHNHNSDSMVSRAAKSRCRGENPTEGVDDVMQTDSLLTVPGFSTAHQAQSILPICSCCKQIRDRSGAWRKLEEYLRDRFHVLFTHSLCPECAKKLSVDPASSDAIAPRGDWSCRGHS